MKVENVKEKKEEKTRVVFLIQQRQPLREIFSPLSRTSIFQHENLVHCTLKANSGNLQCDYLAWM